MLVCLHGFTDTWRTWELVLPELERRHEVLAPTLPGHAGGPPLAAEISDALITDAIERVMDGAGFETAHIVGNSLGGFVALQLAVRGRAASVVALAAELIAHQLIGAARCDAIPLIEYAIRSGYHLEAEKITCPVRIVWGTADRLLTWPPAAARFRHDWLPNADWVELEDVGHCPQLDVPLETTHLVLGFTAS